MSKIRICKSCLEPIEGAHLSALDAQWHPEHFCCVVCDEPITDARFYVHEGEPCHPACYEVSLAPRCSLCRKALTGSHQINYWGERFCSEHMKEYAPCNYCGRLVPYVTKKMRRRSIENTRCDTCASSAIENGEEASVFLPDLVAWVEEQDVHFRQKGFRVDVLDRAEFMARDGGRRDPLGLTTSTRYMRTKRVVDHARIENVAILQGLPRSLFAGVCVHELGHVWLVQHNILEMPSMDEEGFCELLSHRYYLSISATGAHVVGEIAYKEAIFYARGIAENSSPIYGDGFRKLQMLEERIGFAQIVKSLLRKKKLPL